MKKWKTFEVSANPEKINEKIASYASDHKLVEVKRRTGTPFMTAHGKLNVFVDVKFKDSNNNDIVDLV